jgi:hypothetical protein
MPWNFAVAGRGQGDEWWTRFVANVVAHGNAHTIAIEHEDPFVSAAVGVGEAASLLARALGSARPPAVSA